MSSLHRLLRVLVLLALLALALPGRAQPQAVQDLALLVDRAGTETLASVSAPAAQGRFKPLDRDFNAGFTNDVHWLRFSVPAAASGPWLLEVQPATLDDLRLYEPGPAGFVEHHGGDRQPFSRREVVHRNVVFRLGLPGAAAQALPSGPPQTHYLRLQAAGTSQARLALWQVDDFRAAQLRDYAGLAFYFGLLAMLLAGNLMLWASLRDAVFGWFSLNILCAGLTQLGTFGLVSQWLLRDAPGLADFCGLAAQLSYVASAAALFRRLLLVGDQPAWLGAPLRFQVLLCWLALPCYFSRHFPAVAQTVCAYILLVAAWNLWLALRMRRAGLSEAGWMLLATATHLFTIAQQTSGLLGVGLGSAQGSRGVLVVGLVALLCTQMALARRIVAVRNERTQAEQRAAESERAAMVEREAQVLLQSTLAERDRANALLDKTVADLRQAQQVGRVGSWEWDLAADTLQVSPVLAELFEQDPRQPPPVFPDRLAWYAPEHRQVMAQAIARTRATGEPYRVEAELALPSGARRWIENRGQALRDDQGRIVKLVGVTQDISDRRDAQAAHAALLAEEAARRSKDEFLARVSHELRTPLNAVQGFSQLLALDKQVQALPLAAEQVGMIQGAADHLKTMIDDVLDLARSQSGGLHLAAEVIEVGPLAAQCLRWLAPLAEHHQVSSQLQGQDAGHQVFGDRTRLRQVLLNLLSNAIKYNRQGGQVVLSLSRVAGDGQAAGLIEIAVSDTGPGLSPRQISGLFQPFNRLGAELGEVEGSGLGLAVARALVEAMGGTLRVSSASGQGAMFTVRLPDVAPAGLGTVEVAEEVAAVADGPTVVVCDGRDGPPSGAAPHPGAGDAGGDAPTSAFARPFVVLYVEDNRLNATVMRHAMKRLAGVQLEIATDGQAGLDRARQLQPDLVLLDMNLPLLNGTEVLQRLRADSALADTPCVAVSANAVPGDIASALAAGFDDYVTKPFSITRLLGLVEDRRQQAAAACPTAGLPA